MYNFLLLVCLFTNALLSQKMLWLTKQSAHSKPCHLICAKLIYQVVICFNCQSLNKVTTLYSSSCYIPYRVTTVPAPQIHAPYWNCVSLYFHVVVLATKKTIHTYKEENKYATLHLMRRFELFVEFFSAFLHSEVVLESEAIFPTGLLEWRAGPSDEANV